MRSYLGTRYDARNGVFDWDYHMKLHDMVYIYGETPIAYIYAYIATPSGPLQSIPGMGGKVWNVGMRPSKYNRPQAPVVDAREYSAWRETGTAFLLREDAPYGTSNRTLSSGKLVMQVHSSMAQG